MEEGTRIKLPDFSQRNSVHTHAPTMKENLLERPAFGRFLLTQYLIAEKNPHNPEISLFSAGIAQIRRGKYKIKNCCFSLSFIFDIIRDEYACKFERIYDYID